MNNKIIFSCNLTTLHCMHRWASTSISMSAISDIDICYSDIGRRYVGLKTVIPISEGFRYRHLSLFRYPIYKIFFSQPQYSNPRPLFSYASALLLSHCADLWNLGCRISDKVYSYIRYNVGLRFFQSDIADHVISE
jgi:hypothetical protein